MANISVPKTTTGEPVQAFAPGTATTLTFAGVSARVALTAGTSIVRLAAAAACYIAFGDSSVVATSSSTLFPAGAEIFGVPQGATHIAAIQVSSGGTLSITEGTLCEA